MIMVEMVHPSRKFQTLRTRSRSQQPDSDDGISEPTARGDIQKITQSY